MIELKSLHKSYQLSAGRSHIVFEDVNISFPTGKSIGVLGSNGSGKSTLIKLLSGAERPNQGKIIKSGRVSFPLGLSSIFHPDLTGRENVSLVCSLYNAPLKPTLDYVAWFSGLESFFNSAVKRYSSGMLAKLAFGLSLALRFDVYLVDEITEVGDIFFRGRAIEEFQKISAYSSIILVSHNADTLYQYCDTGAVIRERSIHLFSTLDLALEFFKESGTNSI